MSRSEDRFESHSVPVLNREFGATVTIERGDDVTASMTARHSVKIYTSVGQEFGLMVRIVMRDYWLATDKLLFGTQAFVPQRGDRIVDNGEYFEIQPPDDTTPPVERIGTGTYRVHTKRVDC